MPPENRRRVILVGHGEGVHRATRPVATKVLGGVREARHGTERTRALLRTVPAVGCSAGAPARPGSQPSQKRAGLPVGVRVAGRFDVRSSVPSPASSVAPECCVVTPSVPPVPWARAQPSAGSETWRASALAAQLLARPRSRERCRACPGWLEERPPPSGLIGELAAESDPAARRRSSPPSPGLQNPSVLECERAR